MPALMVNSLRLTLCELLFGVLQHPCMETAMFSETWQRRNFVKAACREGEAPAEQPSWARLMPEAAQQELRPPFKVPQTIYREPDCLVHSPMMMQRSNHHTASMAQIICW
jgi:hypothetical protein